MKKSQKILSGFSSLWQWIKNFFRYPAVVIDRILSSGIRSQLLLLAGFIVLVLLSFVIIEWITGSRLTIDGTRNIWFDVYYHFVDPGNQYVVEGRGNRLLVSIVSITGSVLMGGLLISIISNVIDRRVERAREGQISYKFKNHYVIIGFDKMAIGLIKQLFRQCRDDAQFKNVPYLFVIQTTNDVEMVRHELLSKLDAEIDRRTIILHGGRDSREDLEALRLPYCKEIFLLGEEGETDHDSINIECVTLVNRILRETKSPEPEPCSIEELEAMVSRAQARCKRCNVLFEAQSTFAVFQRHDIETVFSLSEKSDDTWFEHLQERYKEDKPQIELLSGLKQSYDRLKERVIDFLPFNFYETWAEKVLVRGKYNPREEGEKEIGYTPIDGEGITYESDRYVHLVVVGMTSMGVALAMKAAHIAHYPNFVRDNKLKTRITFIDLNADTEFDMLRGRYKSLFTQCDYRVVDTVDPSRSYACAGKGGGMTDIEFEFVKGAVESRPVQQLLEKWSEPDDPQLLTIAICFEVPQKSIATALYMPRAVYGKALSILVRQNISCSTIELVRKAHQYRKLRAFGMLDECYDVDDRTLVQARRINYIYNKITPEMTAPQSLEDSVAEHLWKNLTTVHRWSNVYNAHSIPTKWRSFGHLDPKQVWEDPALVELMAQVEHNRWVVERLIMGFRPTTVEEDEQIRSGVVKKKEVEQKHFAHTYLKLYDELDESVKDYDRMIMKYLWHI